MKLVTHSTTSSGLTRYQPMFCMLDEQGRIEERFVNAKTMEFQRLVMASLESGIMSFFAESAVDALRAHCLDKAGNADCKDWQHSKI